MTRLLHRPAADVDAIHPPATFERPRRARDAGAAAEIEDLAASETPRPEPANDLADHQEVQRPIEEREARALTGAIERGAEEQSIAFLDVDCRKCLNPAPNLRPAERRHVALFQALDPGVERVDGLRGIAFIGSLRQYKTLTELTPPSFTSRIGPVVAPLI